MIIVPYDKSFYPELQKIWRLYGWPAPVPEELLPRRGYVALTDENEFIAAQFMYTDPGKIAFIAWPVCALRHRKHVKDQAFQEIIDKLKEDARTEHCRLIYAMTKNARMQEILQQNDMFIAETNATTFVLDLQNSGTSFISD